MKTKKKIESEGFSVTFTNGTGSGGQKRNRTYSCAVVEYDGMVRKCDETRSANKNMNLAYNALRSDLNDLKAQKVADKINQDRLASIGQGVIRTYDFKRSVVKNHLTGKEASLRKVLDGHIELIN
jgi:protein subunit release factor A